MRTKTPCVCNQLHQSEKEKKKPNYDENPTKKYNKSQIKLNARECYPHACRNIGLACVLSRIRRWRKVRQPREDNQAEEFIHIRKLSCGLLDVE